MLKLHSWSLTLRSDQGGFYTKRSGKSICALPAIGAASEFAANDFAKVSRGCDLGHLSATGKANSHKRSGGTVSNGRQLPISFSSLAVLPMLLTYEAF